MLLGNRKEVLPFSSLHDDATITLFALTMEQCAKLILVFRESFNEIKTFVFWALNVTPKKNNKTPTLNNLITDSFKELLCGSSFFLFIGCV